MDSSCLTSYILVLIIALIALTLALRTHYLASRIVKAYKLQRFLSGESHRIVKPRKRYIAFIATCSKPVSKAEFEDSFKRLFIEYFGKALFHKASPQVILFLEDRQRGVIRVSHLFKDHAIAVLGMLKQVNESKCIVTPVKTCGTLKKCTEVIEKKR